MEEWRTTQKVTYLVTDATARMIASASELNAKHSICITHALSLMVEKSSDSWVRKVRKLRGLLLCSTTPKVFYIL